MVYKWYDIPANWVLIYYRSHPLRLNLKNPLNQIKMIFTKKQVTAFVEAMTDPGTAWAPMISPPEKSFPAFSKTPTGNTLPKGERKALRRTLWAFVG